MCEYCEQGEDIVYSNEWGGCFTSWIYDRQDDSFLMMRYECGDDVYGFDVSEMILYCPMCGRKLGGGD